MSTELSKENFTVEEHQEEYDEHYEEEDYEYYEEEDDDYENQYDEGMICAHCHQQEPMYPRKDSDAYCNILCADCYWDEDYRQKHERRAYYALHPEAYEAYRKQAAETMGVEYVPLPQEWYDQAKASEENQEWYQRWVKPVLDTQSTSTEENKIENK